MTIFLKKIFFSPILTWAHSRHDGDVVDGDVPQAVPAHHAFKDDLRIKDTFIVGFQVLRSISSSP